MTPIPLSKPMTPNLARAVYAVLVAGADAPVDHQQISVFVRYMTEGDEQEWRFCGCLGQGGKFYLSGSGVYISCYPEDRTPERLAAIDRTMRGLAVVMGGSNG